jgi:hypothetical protein
VQQAGDVQHGLLAHAQRGDSHVLTRNSSPTT